MLKMARNGKIFFFEIFKILAKFLDHLNWKTRKKISGNHLRMSWNGEKCKKNFWKFDSLSVFTSCQVVIKNFWLQKFKFLDHLNWKTKKKNFGNHLRMSWNGEKCKKKNLEIWQLISCYELSSCQKKNLTSEINWGIANLIVCQKSVWLVKFKISPKFYSFSVIPGVRLLKFF